MKKWISSLLFMLLCFPLCAEVSESKEKEETVIEMDKVSETLGHLLIKQLNNPLYTFNIEKISEGMQAALKGKQAPLTEEQYEAQIMAIQEKIFQKNAEHNLSDAISFLEKNKNEKGVIALTEQLQYKILQAGAEGDAVLTDSTPLIHYCGKLLDGTVFASSKETGTPISLPIKDTIVGFSKGLVGMKKGEKRVLYIHPELAYGVASHLPPNSLLIFEVEVIETNSVAAQTDVDTNLNAKEASEKGTS